MKKSSVLVVGLAAFVLAFGLVLAGCADDDPGKSFDGSTLAGTTWVSEKEYDETAQGLMGIKKTKLTLEFSSDTAGTATAEVTEWAAGATDEQKAKMKGLTDATNGAVTGTYDKAAKTGTYTMKDGTKGTFAVDVEQKTLTTTETEEGEDPEVTIFKLK
jgi:hypothetical protein